MQSIVIVIILLSLIGLYINLGTVADLNKPELSTGQKISTETDKMSPDQIADAIMKEIDEPPKFDAMGSRI